MAHSMQTDIAVDKTVGSNGGSHQRHTLEDAGCCKALTSPHGQHHHQKRHVGDACFGWQKHWVNVRMGQLNWQLHQEIVHHHSRQ